MRHEAHYKAKLVQAFTASATLNHLQSGALITNRGAAGTVTLTLPPGQAGLEFRFIRIAAQALRVDTNAATEKFQNAAGTESTAGKYKELGTDGAELHLLHDGTNWVIVYERGTINDEA